MPSSAHGRCARASRSPADSLGQSYCVSKAHVSTHDHIGNAHGHIGLLQRENTNAGDPMLSPVEGGAVGEAHQHIVQDRLRQMATQAHKHVANGDRDPLCRAVDDQEDSIQMLQCRGKLRDVVLIIPPCNADVFQQQSMMLPSHSGPHTALWPTIWVAQSRGVHHEHLHKLASLGRVAEVVPGGLAGLPLAPVAIQCGGDHTYRGQGPGVDRPGPPPRPPRRARAAPRRPRGARGRAGPARTASPPGGAL